MERHATTPFGRRPATLGRIAAGLQVRRAVEAAGRPGSNAPAAVDKWRLFRSLTEAKGRLGVSDRALGVLNALLSFHPETALALPKAAGRAGEGTAPDEAGEAADPYCDLVVFPSNRALCLRAHGMSEATLRRHLSALVEAGLIARRDSPNGKRYARKAEQGATERFSDAFGFDLLPLVARAPEIEALAEAERRSAMARRLLKERISLLRRDSGKLIALGLDEALPGDWEGCRRRYMALMTPLRRIRGDEALHALANALAALREDAAKLLESQIEAKNPDGDDAHSERHQSNSKTQWPEDLEPASKEQGAMREGGEVSVEGEREGREELPLETKAVPATEHRPSDPAFTLGLVMEACPEVNHWATSGRVRSWPEFLATVALIRPMLGVSPDAWAEARKALGETEAHIVLAAILQRSEHASEAERAPVGPSGAGAITVNGSPAIRSAGGYLRALTEQARAGAFSLGPLLMALIGQRTKARRQKNDVR